MSNLIDFVESQTSSRRNLFPDFSVGDTICVDVKIKESSKERIQKFLGVVIQRRNKGSNGETFSVLKHVDEVTVERTFPILSPNIDKIEVKRKGKVRRARIFYLRSLRGKKARLKEKISAKRVEL